MFRSTKTIKVLPRGVHRSLSAGAVVRNDWKKEEIQAIYDLPLMDLVFKAAAIRSFFTLLSSFISSVI